MGADAQQAARAVRGALPTRPVEEPDPLTGLPMRDSAVEAIAAALASGKGDVAVVCLDLDHLALVNDLLGRASGDDVLRVTARRLQNVVRAGTLVARLEQDTFAVLVEGISRPTEAQHVADRLAAALADPLAIGEDLVRVGVDIGIALAGTRPTTAEALLAEAQAAVRDAKDRGESVGRQPRERADRRRQLAADLRADARHEQLWIAYQPQLDLRTDSRVGVEALLRWTHPLRGAIAPAEFLPLADRTDAADGLAEFTLLRACGEIAATGLNLDVCVNLSARALDDPRLIASVEHVLTATGLPRSALCLEIAETTLLRDAVVATRRLNALRDLGVRLAIDDFGTGYASLAHLRRLPIDVLKIDKSFVAGLCESGDSEVTIVSIVALAHALGLTVTAEGVETADQLDMLRQIGCDRAQGFHIGRPVIAADLAS